MPSLFVVYYWHLHKNNMKFSLRSNTWYTWIDKYGSWTGIWCEMILFNFSSWSPPLIPRGGRGALHPTIPGIKFGNPGLSEVGLGGNGRSGNG